MSDATLQLSDGVRSPEQVDRTSSHPPLYHLPLPLIACAELLTAGPALLRQCGSARCCHALGMDVRNASE